MQLPQVLICNTGICRGREPEYLYMQQRADLTLLGYSVQGKAHEQRYAGVRHVYPQIKPTYGIDPIHLLRRSYSCMSFAQFQGIEDVLHRSDVVVTQDPNFFTAGITSAASRLGKPVVMVAFENVVNHSIFHSHALPYRRKMMKTIELTTRFVPQTWRAMDFLRVMGVPTERMRVIYPGVDLMEFHPGNTECNPVERGVRILVVGTLTENKGIREIIEAFGQVRAARPGTLLTLVGTGPLSDWLNRESATGAVRHLHGLSASAMADLYRNSDLFVIASKPRKALWVTIGEEQLSFALIEAMASGLPVLSTRTGSLPEILATGNILVEPGNSAMLAEGMLQYIDNPKLRRTVGASNAARARERFDARKQSGAFLDYALSSKGV